MLLKTILLTSVILLSYHVFFGQTYFPYDQEWKLIDSLIFKKNLPKSALLEVNKVYVAAKKDKQEAQWVKAIIYKYYLKEGQDPDVTQSIREFEDEISTATPKVAALLKSIEAEELFQYVQGHRYQFRNRTAMVADTSSDIATWTISRLTSKISNLYLSSLDNADMLKRTPLDNFNPVLIIGNVRELRPTLYDLLTWRALDYFRMDNPDPGSSNDNSFWENSAVFSEAPFFMHYGFKDQDSLSNHLIALRLYQQLLRFHTKDIRLDAWIDADISRIQFVYQYAQMPEKDSLYLNALARITRQFGTLSSASQAWFLQAQWWTDKAAAYNPLGDTSHRYDNIKAVNICRQVVQHPDSSEGKSNCELLLEAIHGHSFSLKIEQVNIPNLPFRALLSYKNIGQIFGRIIRIDDAIKESIGQSDNRKIWRRLIQMTAERTFQQQIPDTRDYQQHRIEIKMDALTPGQYILLVSSDSAFSDSAFMVMSTFFCSNIAFIKTGIDYFVLNRDSGHPLKSVNIKSFIQRYDNGRSAYQPSKTYLTDQHGYFHLSSAKEFSDQMKLEFYNGRDYLSNTQYLYYSREDKDDSRDQKKWRDNIFTDRSIYRPGQTVYFKGLLITQELKTGKYKVIGQQQTKIFLLDVNKQKIDSLLLTSNEYGSIHGNFQLPQNLLNGEFSLLDGQTEDEETFSVEEYKRPSFYVTYDSVKDSYRVGDTIELQGSAIAYAGNTIDGASMTYRVYRESRFPYPWLFRYYPSRSDREIMHGDLITDASGKFNIRFKAQPDKSISKSTKPIYTYRIESTVTDLNGESRSATTTVAASYQSFEISSSLSDESRILKDSFYIIPVTTINTSGVFIKEKLSVSIIHLTAPSRLIRKRYWEQPDQFTMSEADYIKFFPNDEYENESDVKFWRRGANIYTRTEFTAVNGSFKLDKETISSITPGWYLIEFKAKDLDGEEIIDKKYIEITDNTHAAGSPNYNIIKEENRTVEPGGSAKIQTGSDAKDLFVIRMKQGIGDSTRKYTFYKLDQNVNSTSVDINESDRGGFALNDIFVKNNRWYSSVHNVIVPWSNKELQISYLTWKDKTQPGSKEQWKIRIAGYKKDQVMSEVLACMYDASLDQFKNHSWKVPDIYPVYNQGNIWDNSSNFSDAESDMRPGLATTPKSQRRNIYDELFNFDDGPGGGGVRMMSAMGNDKLVKDIDIALSPLKKGYYKSAQANMAPPGIESAKFTPPKIVKDGDGGEETKPPETDNTGKINEGPVQIRKNFSETAFFQPDLKTDAQGNVEINFTMPDALTKWKWMMLASTRDLSFGYAEKFVATQKELMLQTNMPRFFREGDTMLLPVKIANLSTQNMTGTVQLEWQDAGNNLNIDPALGNYTGTQPFAVSASQSSVVFFPVIIPPHFNQPLLYRITARTNMKGANYGDGEENIIPVLSNRMLVTESLPLNMEGKEEKRFVFAKLLKSGESASLQNQSLTVEYTTNPSWYAVQSLPYLIEFPYECAEQTFNRFYANALASHIVQVSPTMQAIFEKWRNTDTAALLSNLQKNEELKSVLLRETPWVLAAQSETQQKKNLALLFDMIKMRSALKSALDKLQQMQSGSGGFAWFKGGRDDRYITQYIVSGIGKLRKLKSVPADLQAPLNKMARAAISFLDKEIDSDYKKRNKSLSNQNISPIQIQYLYVRSFFPDIDVPGNSFNALNYYRKLSVEEWMKESVYMQGMIALFLSRTGDVKTSKDILASLKENAINSASLGMYWKSVNNGFYWQEAPVETQSLLIETFQELKADHTAIDQLKYWLLQQKRSSHWPSTKATADACYALLLNGSDWLTSQQNVSIQLGNYKINSSEGNTEAGTGYYKKQIPGDQVLPDMGNIDVVLSNTTSTVNGQRPTANDRSSTANRQPSTVNPSWGAVYWQYFENLDKITDANTQLSITKNLFIEKNSDKGPVLEIVSERNILKPGDKLKMRITIKSDRDLEYVHLKDMRAACLEPVSVLSGYQWQDGLGYYQTIQDASTSFFFDRMPKGTFVFEYPVFVSTAGNYGNGISMVECMYAPEFSAHSEGARLHVESK